MASLLGKADTGIISAARSAEQADRPADLSRLYQRKADKFDEFLDMVGSAFDTKTQADKDREAQYKEWQETVQTHAATGKENDASSELLFNTTNKLTEALKNYDGDKNSLEYKKLEQKLNRLVDMSNNNIDVYNKLINSDLGIIGSGKEMDLLAQIMDDHNNNTNNSNISWNEEIGDVEFTLKDDPNVKMTMSELERRVNRIDPAGEIEVMELANGVMQNRNKREWKGAYRTDFKNGIEKILKDKNKKYNVMHGTFTGMEHSFYEALNGADPKLQGEIFDALIAVNFDYDKDGNVDTKEEYNNLTPENLEIMQEAIMKTSKGDEIIAEYLTDKVGEDVYNIGEKSRRKSQKGGGGDSSSSLKNSSYTTGPDGTRTWTAPAAKQEAFNFFSKKHKPGDVYDGTHAYYAQIGSDSWNAYSSLNDYNEHKKTGNPELKKGTYTQAQIIGFESGVNIGGRGGKSFG